MQKVLSYFSTYTPLGLRHAVGPALVSCVVEACRLGLEPLCDTYLSLSVILKTLTLTKQEFLEVQ